MQKTVILISGKMRSGKNQFAEFVANELQLRNKTVEFNSFAFDLKQNCAFDFSYMMEQINSHVAKIKEELSYSRIDKKSLKNVNNMLDDLTATKYDNWNENKTLISRLLIQTYGTQIFRDRIDVDYWVKLLASKILARENCEFELVTDARFANEINITKELCSADNVRVITVRIERDIPMNALYSHVSENDIDNFEFDHIINNNGSLELLTDKAKLFVDELLRN